MKKIMQANMKENAWQEQQLMLYLSQRILYILLMQETVDQLAAFDQVSFSITKAKVEKTRQKH
jgi:hypothetical protein